MTGGPAGSPVDCGWAGAGHWTVLQSRFGRGAEFLTTWRAWLDDVQRPGLLHFVGIAPVPATVDEIVGCAQEHPALQPLVRELATQWFGLAPGVHRLAFAQGRVLLTLAVAQPLAALRSLALRADALLLGGAHARADDEQAVLTAAVRMCRRGARVTAWQASDATRGFLVRQGFEWACDEGWAPGPGSCVSHGRFSPRWSLRHEEVRLPLPSDAIVIGAGLAGAAAAASLARRGWRVQVLDAAPEPAAGASALPAGLMAPHASADDNLLSRLTRAGIRITLQEAALRLRDGLDWAPGGVLERNVATSPAGWPAEDGLEAWTAPASEDQKAAAGLPVQAGACWHERAGWIRPAALVHAWLADPGVSFRGGCAVGALEKTGSGWRLQGVQGRTLGEAPLVVVAAALGGAPWMPQGAALQAVRGQVTYGSLGADAPALGQFPVNGNGHFLPEVTVAGGRAWLTGSSYGRGDADAAPRLADRQDNLHRLHQLLPAAGAALAPRFDGGEVHDWSGVRCVARDRRPLLGEIEAGLWVSTAMGSRGLSFAPLCGELLAARLHGEPLPLSRRLARALDLARLL